MDHSIFPIEIYTEIISYLAEHDNIHNISFVSKAFTHIARKHIFKHVQIDCYDDNTAARLERLAAIFERQPQLTPFVQCFRFLNGHDIHHDGKLASLFSFPDLREMELELFESAHIVPADACSHSGLGCSSLLERYLHAGSLTSLTLSRVQGLPLDDILSSRTLRQLHLRQCSMTVGTYTAPGFTFNLTTLSASDCQNLSLQLLARCPDLIKLEISGKVTFVPSPPFRTIKLYCDKDAYPFHKLESADFDAFESAIWDFVFDAAEECGVAALPALRRLNIRNEGGPVHNTPTGSDRELPLRRLVRRAPSLEDLSVKGDPAYWSVDTIAHQLCNLALDWTHFTSVDDAFAECVRSLGALRCPHLDTLRIQLKWMPHSREEGVRTQYIGSVVSDMENLAGVLLDATAPATDGDDMKRFLSLKRVDLSINTRINRGLRCSWTRPEMMKLMSALQPCLKRLEGEGRGMVDVRIGGSGVGMERFL